MCCAIQEACANFLFFPKILRGVFPRVSAVSVRGACELVQLVTTPGTHKAASVSLLQRVTASWPEAPAAEATWGPRWRWGGWRKMTALPSSLPLTCYVSHLRGGDMSRGQTQVQLGGVFNPSPWQRDGETMETVTDFFSMSLVTTFLTAFGRNEPPFFSGSQAELTSLLCDFFIVNEALVSHLCRRGRLKTRFYLLQMATGRWFEYLHSEWTKPIYMTKQRFTK